MERKNLSPSEALEYVAKSSDKSMRKMSIELGHRVQYLSVLLANARVPRLDTLLKVANLSGWDLIARKRDGTEEVYIQPPEEDSN